MEMNIDFHFPKNINLNSPPLTEAWLEVRWQLEATETPNFAVDRKFPFALGLFRSKVKNEFGNVTPLEPSRFPQEMVPHSVHYRFTPIGESWPMLQLGPGVASVNFTNPYTWEVFKTRALYLREQLNYAYENEIQVSSLALRYRNAFEFDYESDDIFNYLQKSLNITIAVPKYISNTITRVSWPQHLNTSLGYALKKPTGQGAIRIATGRKTDTQKPVIVLELEVISIEDSPHYWSTDEGFANWLEDAHDITHEWFFAIIEGDLFDKYQE